MKISVACLSVILCQSQSLAFVQNFLPSVPFRKTPSQLYTSSSEEIIDAVDKAPCFDSICSSDPDSSDPDVAEIPAMGEATQRLGLSSGPTVWSEFGRLAMENPSIANLGQGFPDWLPPQFAIDALVEGVTDVAHNSPHQYTRTAGHPKLVKELAGRYSRHMNRKIDPFAEVSVTVGASQALYLALQTLIKPGA
jgi:DNA-binding transcriptional MocR family regulator